MDYKQKYLKYKTKYLQLKEQSGGFNWLTKKASDAANYMGRKASDAANKISDKYDCYMDNHSEICRSLLNKYKELKKGNKSDFDIDKELKDKYIYKVQQHNTDMMKRETRKNNSPDNEYDWTNMVSDIADLTQQRNKLSTIRTYYEYLSDCISMKCITIDWKEYPGLIKFLESKLGHSIINLSFDDRNNNLEQEDYDKWNNPEEEIKETKEENNNNTTKENNVLSKKQINDIKTKGFSEGPEPDELILGGFSVLSDLTNWYHGTCNEIHEKINAIYQNYKRIDEKSADSQMGGEFTRIRNYEKKEKMTEEEKNLYNEIKPYDFNWNKYKKKLEEKNFCVEKKQ